MKKKATWMPQYDASDEEVIARDWCINKGIRISPRGISGDPGHWFIEVSMDGETWHRSPHKFNPEQIWTEYYKVCLYYFNK